MRSIRVDDQTTRARIRDAAIEVFGRDGFATGVRAIATAAGVSPGLVNHHFGSKNGLRQVCDGYVLDVVRESKSGAMSASPAGTIAQLAEIDEYAPYVAYIAQSFTTGGTFAKQMFENMVDDTAAYLEEGVANGRLKPSRDPRARAKFLTQQNVGGMLLHMRMAPGGTDFKSALRDLAESITLPALELYTEGLFTDDATLTAYLHHRETT
ncbi:TetR family transcriptional regulator [Rhodococcus sp. BGS-1C]|jgi:AcrR family transcriptional regulator|uniref:TetR/AcrR family transcriptional regulator n=1 Tax=Nocardiaceae TaxID=85025 RepID=UPI0019D1DA15|nr:MULTISPECIES: TetR/AcrR family transcriptional regulator [Rhodococcus]MCC8927938.1 TetR/AcrR family transcriptional regulator [Rhodococcus sp. I2R]MCZ4277620.1 TetR family transcriptional regulator [Rhodococcus yunnanensis]